MLTIVHAVPAVRADGSAYAPVPDPVPGLVRPQLLVVDDEPQNLKTFQRVWRKHYDIEAASDGAAGLRLLAERRFDAVLTDFGMPGMDGAAFVEAARRIQAVSFVLVTGYDETPEVRALQERGLIFAVLGKPWRPALMEDVIARAGAHTRTLRGQAR